MRNFLFALFLIVSISVYSQTNCYPTPKIRHWALSSTIGYTTVITPFQRTNYSVSVNLRYRVGVVTMVLQPTVNYTIQTKTPDFRIGVRLQYDFLSW